MASLKVGDTLDVSGPRGALSVAPSADASSLDFTLGGSGGLLRAASIGLVAGGSGITPCLQLARTALASVPRGAVSVTLVYATRRADRIMCWDEIEALRLMCAEDSAPPPAAAPPGAAAPAPAARNAGTSAAAWAAWAACIMRHKVPCNA